MRAVICGAGIAGLALANRLRHHDWDVHLVERAPGPRGQGYMIDFFGPGFEALTAMGLRDALRDAASPVDSLRYIDSRGRTTVSLDYDVFSDALDGEIVSIMRPALERMLHDSVADRIDVRHRTSVERIEDRHVALSDGSWVEADLVVGADGIHSHVRSLAFGPESRHVRYLGMHTGAFVVTDPEAHRQVGNRFVLTESVDRQMGFYGLGEDRVAVFAVHRAPDPDLPPDARQSLRRTFAGMGALPDRVLDRCPPHDQVYLDQVAQSDVPAWSTGRVTLVGDAAHWSTIPVSVIVVGLPMRPRCRWVIALLACPLSGPA